MTSGQEAFGQTSGLLTAVMASCRDAIVACSLDGTIEAWNRGAEEIYQYTSEEAVGRNIAMTTPPDGARELQRLREAARNGRAIEHFDTVRTRKSGESFPAAVCGFPIKDGNGVAVGYATIERDVSDRVRSANELRRALAEAQEATAAKSRFLANASHELRTPMNAIVGMTALALEEDISLELRDYLETIRDSSDSMLHLINDVLDLSKFQAEEFELDELPFDPRELVEGSTRVLGPAAHAKGLELVCHVAPDIPSRVVGDPVRLRQIITNLVSNAVKFTAAGEVVVELTLVSAQHRRCTLSFRVVDTGIGISKEDQTKIFAPFSQVDAATTRRYTGTGLGLTITQHLIQCFGSRLELKSTPGAGSCFGFDLTFPVDDLQSGENDALTARLKGLSVLVVDDNEASRQALIEQFNAWGMQAQAVANGAEAIERLRRGTSSGDGFDVAVVDALMPGIDGFTVASQIEADEEIPTKPIIMASATDRLEFSRRCAEAGAAAFVQKPISQSQLLNAIGQATGAAALEVPHGRGLFDKPNVGPLNILLVEDTPANRKVVQTVLSKRGHRLEVAVNGREAVDEFRKKAFDLIIMDVQMPIMDGFQATEAIREIERADSRTPTPVVAMTAHSMRGDRERCLRAGMNRYLSKPLDLERLIRVVEGVAAGQSGGIYTSPLEDTTETAESPATADIAAMSTGGPTVDLDAALARLRGDRNLLKDMIGFFREDAPTLLASISESLASGDLGTLERAAHSLKGLSATFDAESVVVEARDVELAARAADLESLPNRVQTLQGATTDLLSFFDDYLGDN